MTGPVLVVESDTWLGDHYERQLTRHGFVVARAGDPYTAIDVIDEVRPSAIVMSMFLAGSSGLSLLHELQTYTDTARIPVIVCDSPTHFTLDELRPYGVQKLLDPLTMLPDDIVMAVRSVLV